MNSRATQSTAALLFGIVLGLFVSVVQQLGVVAQLAAHWEDPVKSMLESLSLLSLDIEILRLDCIKSHGAAERFTLKVLFIFVTIAMLVMIHILAVVLLHQCKFQKRMHSLVGRSPLARIKYGRLGDRVVMMCIWTGCIGSVFIIFYIAVTATVLQPLQCESHPNPNPEQTLRSYPGCAGAVHCM
eukprot:5214238-Amphidinium_carterae.1